MVKLLISNSILITFIIFFVGAVGALCQNIWLGKLGTKNFKDNPVKKRGIIPSVMLFFPLPFTTYTYIFFRALTSGKPKRYLTKLTTLRNKTFHSHLKR